MASVDEALKGRLLDLLEEVLHEERVPALLVTHDPGDVRRLAQWVVRIESGAVQAVGLPADLIHALGGPKPS
jgi:ABC-type molybdate transport system ATPase subunit